MSETISDIRQDTTPLESPQAFRDYCDRVKQQLHTFVIERIRFLEAADADLVSLHALAVKSGSEPLQAELAALREKAVIELSALRGEPADGREVTEAVVRERGASAPDLAPTSLQAAMSDRQVADAGINGNGNGSAAAPPATAPPRPAPRPIPAAPPVPPTPYRPLEEIYRDTDTLTEQAEREGDCYSGTTGLVRLKALLCRQRGLQAELAQRDIQHWPLKSLLNYLRRRIDDEHGPGHYLIPLRAELWPTEAWPWNTLADLYDLLADAHDALDWYDKDGEKLSAAERQELLECIAAHQTRLWRHLQAYFPRQNDEHQIKFFRELCGIAEEEDLYLSSLQERCPDEQLAERAEQMPVVLEHLRLDKKNRAKREAALQHLRTLVARPDFGAGEDDATELTKAVAACRAQGAPASSVALRAVLMPWLSLLEESEEKPIQEVVRELQKEAERLARKAQAEPQEPEAALSDMEQAELDAVRALVRGKRCLFIGGICREESRQRLERELELAELVWPSTNGAESVYKFEADIQNTDITVIMVRFMRTGWGQARELAVRHGKMFVRLPAGYGLNQVVRQFYRQLPVPEPATATK